MNDEEIIKNLDLLVEYESVSVEEDTELIEFLSELLTSQEVTK